MSAQPRLSPRKRRTILDELSRDRLAELTSTFNLDVDDRRTARSHVDAIVHKRSLDFRLVLEALRREELQAACVALGLDSDGRVKAKLVERIFGADGSGLQKVDGPEEVTKDSATVDDSTETSQSMTETPNGALPGGALKSELRRFAIDIAGGYKGRSAPVEFAAKLLRCFGWREDQITDVEMPALLTVVRNGERATRPVALLWKSRRLLVEVVKHDVMLDFAWKELLGVCLQTDPPPQYVVLTNQRDLHLYDMARDRNAPRLSIAVDDLPKYSEAFPFLSPAWFPGMLPKIINVSKVSGEVAELVARLYRSLKEQHPHRESDVVRFTLQCILTMFAEDIKLLPQEYFTGLLYEGARAGDVEKRLRELFVLMSTRDIPGPRAVPYFNGGLFTNPVVLPLGEVQLTALTKASEANWKYVDPHIFGSVFQGIMNDAERHKSGAHYTPHDDIMRVVGPTIVEPWRDRIRSAKSLTDLLDVRSALLKFRVLDPACGSGNFLYVAFRELYRLDTELLARMREFPSTQGQGKSKVSWGLGIQTENFFGIDVNPFAVELAKVTLNIAKKIAFDERHQVAVDVVGQAEFDLDPSLPLDNLDDNIVRGDALFTSWPHADAIVGNPPFLGGTKIRAELGERYVVQLRQRFPEVSGKADYCVFWFRRAHESLKQGGRAGLVGTNSIREGTSLDASTGFVVANGGTITNAVSSRPWLGDAVVNVSMVNWIKGDLHGPHKLLIEEHVHELAVVAPHLGLHPDLQGAKPIRTNEDGSTKGLDLGTRASQFGRQTALTLSQDPSSAPFVKPIAHGKHLLAGRLSVDPEYTVDMSMCPDVASASCAKEAFKYLMEAKLPSVEAKAASYEGWLERWWQPWRSRASFFHRIAGARRLLVCSRHAARPIFVFISRQFVPTDSLQLFGFDDDYSHGILQSNIHWNWAVTVGSKIKEDTRYTMEVWSTFPWPQELSETEVAAVATAAQNLRSVRAKLMAANGWSLRALHQAAEVAGPHPLKDAQAALDESVRIAYGVPAEQDGTEFLLELNKLVAEDEAQGHQVHGPGVPRGLDPKDPRWNSDDCIEPPKV